MNCNIKSGHQIVCVSASMLTDACELLDFGMGNPLNYFVRSTLFMHFEQIHYLPQNS